MKNKLWMSAGWANICIVISAILLGRLISHLYGNPSGGFNYWVTTSLIIVAIAGILSYLATKQKTIVIEGVNNKKEEK